MNNKNFRPAIQVADEKGRGLYVYWFYKLKRLVSLRVLLFFAVLAKSAICNAQSGQGLTALYFSGGCGFGRNASPYGCGITFIWSDKWGGSISTKTREVLAENLPSDFKPGGTFPLFGTTVGKPHQLPNDKIHIVSYMVLREFKTRTQNIRFGIEAGPAAVTYRETVFVKRTTVLLAEDNYEYRYENKRIVGFTMRTKIEFPVSRGFGFEFAVLGNVNKYRSFAGVEAYLTFGYVRNRIPPTNVFDDAVKH